MGVVIDRLPKPGGRRLRADRLAGADEREERRRNRQVSCSHLAFSEAHIARFRQP
jgi:hypothetical protein